MGEYFIILNKKALMFIIAFAFVLAIAGTSAAAVNETENVTTSNVTDECVGSDPIINGTITVNEYGHTRPLEGATVIVNSNSGKVLASTTTDANGYYSVNFYSAETTFNIIASYVGCTPITQSITVANGPNYPTDPNKYGTLNFTLTPKTATLTGTGNGRTVYIQGQNKNGFAGVINVRVDGTTYVAYCIDLFTPISINDQLLVNGPLPGTAGDLPSGVEWDKVSYILNNYSPSSNNEAAAIQCAIWYFTSVHYGTYNSSAPLGTYYQYMTAPRDGRIDGYYGDTTVRNRAWAIIDAVNAATIPPYPNSVTVTPETTTVANGQTVTVTATVKDINGNPLQGVTVNFQRTAGTLSRTSGTTDANGQVTTVLTLGNNNNSVVTAYVSGNYGNLLYDDQYATVRKQNLVARNVLPLTISDISIVNTAPTADVALSQTVNGGSSATVNVGNTVTYIITANNNGPSTATGIVISDVVPAGLTGVTVTPSVGTYYNGVWTIPSLANGNTATLTITGTVTTSMAGLTTVNTANKISQTEYDPNNPDTTATSLYVPQVDISVRHNPWYYNSVAGNYQYEYTSGNTPVFYVIVSNSNKYDDATNVIVEYTLGTGYNYRGYDTQGIGTTTYNELTRTLTWNINYMPKGSILLLKIFTGCTESGNMTPALTNEVSATHFDQFDINNTNNYAECALTINPSADIGVEQTYTTSTENNTQYITYTITATNNGPNNATNVKITDKLPTGLTLYKISLDGGNTWIDSNPSYNPTTGVWTIGNFNYTEPAKTLMIKATITGTGTIKNTVTKTQNEHDWNLDNNSKTTIFTSGTYTPTTDVYIVRHVPWYYNSVAGNYQYEYTSGNTPVFYVIVSNSNKYDDATNVIVEYTLGTGYNYRGYDTQGIGTTTYNELTRTLTWNINYMPKGSILLLKIFTGCTESGNMTPALTNEVSATHFDQFDINNTNNYAECALTINPSADIGVEQTYTTSTENNTQYITYTITATNNGPNNATNVKITDKLPTGLTLYKISLDGGNTWIDSNPSYNPTTGVWTIGNFNYTEPAKTLMIKATITGTGTIKNTVTKTQNEHDWNLDNNSKTVIYVKS